METYSITPLQLIDSLAFLESAVRRFLVFVANHSMKFLLWCARILAAGIQKLLVVVVVVGVELFAPKIVEHLSCCRSLLRPMPVNWLEQRAGRQQRMKVQVRRQKLTRSLTEWRAPNAPNGALPSALGGNKFSLGMEQQEATRIFGI